MFFCTGGVVNQWFIRAQSMGDDSSKRGGGAAGNKTHKKKLLMNDSRMDFFLLVFLTSLSSKDFSIRGRHSQLISIFFFLFVFFGTVCLHLQCQLHRPHKAGFLFQPGDAVLSLPPPSQSVVTTSSHAAKSLPFCSKIVLMPSREHSNPNWGEILQRAT